MPGCTVPIAHDGHGCGCIRVATCNAAPKTPVPCACSAADAAVLPLRMLREVQANAQAMEEVARMRKGLEDAMHSVNQEEADQKLHKLLGLERVPGPQFHEGRLRLGDEGEGQGKAARKRKKKKKKGQQEEGQSEEKEQE